VNQYLRRKRYDENSSMPRLRTFIALDLGKTIRDRLVSLQENFAKITTGVKWVEPQNLHITLLFLGEVEDREIPAVCRAVEEVAQSLGSFSMSVEGAGCFPNARRPNTLWVSVGAGVQETCKLHDALEPPLMALGCYRREERKFTPHVTLGRIRSVQAPTGFAQALAKYQTWKAGDVTIRDVHVMSSELTPTGPVYTVLSRAKLGGG
jgi:RNA 2',3'-cyclic 3'-phosphodiesterase